MTTLSRRAQTSLLVYGFVGLFEACLLRAPCVMCIRRFFIKTRRFSLTWFPVVVCVFFRFVVLLDRGFGVCYF